MSLRFAVLGAGRIGQVHARAIDSVPADAVKTGKAVTLR